MKLKFDMTFNREKLGYDFFDNTIKANSKCYIVKSDTGTGKTTAIKHYLKDNNEKFLSITSRRSLAIEQFRVFDEFGVHCQLYLNKDKNKGDSLTVQAESLQSNMKYIDKSTFQEYVLIIDEVESFIKHIVESPTLKNKKQTIELILLLIKNCKYCFAVDASVGNLTRTFFNFWDDIKPVYIFNQHKNYQGIKAKELKSFDNLIKKIQSYEKYIVCCDSANKAVELYQRLGGEESDIKLIKRNCNNQELAELLNLDDHNKLIFSPKIVYGLDSVLKRPVFAYYMGGIISSGAMYQQISRNRSITNLYIYFSMKPTKKRAFNNFKDVTARGENLEEWHKEISNLFEYSKIDKLILKLNNICMYEKDKDDENIFMNFIDKLKVKGFDIKLQPEKTEHKRTSDKALLFENMKNSFNSNTNIFNKYLKLPEDVANKDENIYLLCDQYKFIHHLNICHWLDSNTISITYDFSDAIKDSVAHELIKCSRNKYRMLNKIINLSGSTKEKIIIKEELKESEYKELDEQYKLMYPKGTLTIDTNKKVINYIMLLIRDLFGDSIYNKERDQRKNSGRNYYFELDTEGIKRHNELKAHRRFNIEEIVFDDEED